MRKEWRSAIFALPFFALSLPFLIVPTMWGFIASFTDYSPFQPNPSFVGLANFAYLLSDGYFTASFRTLAVFVLVTVAAEMSLGFGIAYLLREPFHGRGALRVLLLVPWLIGPIANGVMWRFLFASDNGIVGYILGAFGLPTQPSPLGSSALALPATMIAEIWQKTPLVIFLLYPGMQSLPSSLLDQAILEGASAPSRMRNIVLPWLRPLSLAVSLLLLGGALGAFEGTLMLTGGGPGSATLTPALYGFLKAFKSNNWRAGTTSAWFIAACVLLVAAGYLPLARREER
jgi:multiple sugar transport system permease protein